VIGLTGTIGGGKTQVASMLKSKGALVIDADRAGHEALELPEVCGAIIEHFGPDVVAQKPQGASMSGHIDRKALAKIVFAVRPELNWLETVLHPRMRRTFQEIISHAQVLGRASAVVLDAAILFEAGWDDLCDLVIFVDAPLEVRANRVALDRGWTERELRDRESAQWPSERKRDRADIVIHNDSSLEVLRESVDLLFKRVTSPQRGTPL
jgi:dephospho-CoA kinase